MSRRFVVASTLILSWAVARPATMVAQAQPPAPAAGPAADPMDVASPEAIVAAVYDVLSGTATQQRNWDRYRSLFIPGGLVIPTGAPMQPGAKARVRAMSPGEYAKSADPQLKTEGFFEREIARVVESFGSIMHVFSTYESRHAPEDREPFGRGINSFQLFNDGTRWWIVTVYWDRERPGNPIPAKYLPSGRK